MKEAEDDGDKPYEATEHKLLEARAKGEVAFSNDLVLAAGYVGFAGFAVFAGAAALATGGALLQALLEHGFRSGPDLRDATILVRQGLTGLVVPLTGWFAFPAVIALLAILAQGGQVFAPSRIAPALRKISPLAAIRQRLGAAGLVEFAKGLVKSALITAVFGIYLVQSLPVIMSTVSLAPRQIVVVMSRAVIDVALLAAAIALVVGLFDLVWQRVHHLQRHRMSRKEREDEHRETEGDPMLKGQRRQAGIAIAMNQAAAAVPKAEVVIVNPTHFAVALAWDRGGGRAPICVAKGVDEVALRIRTIAAEAGVPVRSDPMTARALHASVDVGQEIPRAHFRAVAAAIRFADRVRGRRAEP
jgi:flagellar biosynthesis protein FlhB